MNFKDDPNATVCVFCSTSSVSVVFNLQFLKPGPQSRLALHRMTVL